MLADEEGRGTFLLDPQGLGDGLLHHVGQAKQIALVETGVGEDDDLPCGVVNRQAR